MNFDIFPNQPFAFEEAYRRYLDGLLANDRHQCRVSFEQWLASDAGPRLWMIKYE